MKTDVIKSALRTGEIDAGIVAGLSDMDEFDRVPLFYEPFHVYVSRESELFGREVIRTSDLSGAQLWLLDEGHCFRDQLVRFCQLKAAKASQMAYHLGSMETFMRMVEGEEGLPLFRDWPCCSSVRHKKSWYMPLLFLVRPVNSFC